MAKREPDPRKHIDVKPETAGALQNEFEIGLSRAVLSKDSKNIEALHLLGHALTRAGRHEEALVVDRSIIALTPEDPHAYYNLACSYSHLKEIDRALQTLEQALERGYRDFSHLLRDRDLQNVRQDPRFRKLLEKRWGKRRSSRP